MSLRYYCSLYILRSSTRVGAVPPSIWGPWTVVDTPKYADQMTLDYNFEVTASAPACLAVGLPLLVALREQELEL